MEQSMSTVPYRPFPNQFRADLRAGKRLIGCWASLAAPITAEILGLAGFDWILLDGEHSPNDMTKRLLDIGFHNFLLPYIETADQARNAVASTRYPPKGIRGVSIAHRSNMYGTVQGYFPDINDNITVLLQIETRSGLEAVDEIAAVDGVDGLFVGPSDLAAAFGHLGNPNHPDVQDAIRHIFTRARAAGKAAGILTGVEADARRYLDWGATFVAVGSDLGLFRAASEALCNRFKDARRDSRA
jgi:2-dehydro-3-deoxyglucarate aldolase